MRPPASVDLDFDGRHAQRSCNRFNATRVSQPAHPRCRFSLVAAGVPYEQPMLLPQLWQR